MFIKYWKEIIVIIGLISIILWVLNKNNDKDVRGNETYYFKQGDKYFVNKEYDKAIESYKTSLELNPNNKYAYQNLGSLYGLKHKYIDAIKEYEKVLKLDSKNDIVYYNIGIFYTHEKKYSKAIFSLKKAIEINPKLDVAHYSLGVLLAKNKEYEKAIDSYEKSIDINSNYASAYTNLFALQLIQGVPFNELLEKIYIEQFYNNKEMFIKYEMLKIFENLRDEKKVNLEEWREKYALITFGSWSFEGLHEWIEAMEDSGKKEKLLEALKMFENHQPSTKD